MVGVGNDGIGGAVVAEVDWDAVGLNLCMH